MGLLLRYVAYAVNQQKRVLLSSVSGFDEEAAVWESRRKYGDGKCTVTRFCHRGANVHYRLPTETYPNYRALAGHQTIGIRE
eukprot:4361839-Amphidinium_carterae.1